MSKLIFLLVVLILDCVFFEKRTSVLMRLMLPIEVTTGFKSQFSSGVNASVVLPLKSSGLVRRIFLFYVTRIHSPRCGYAHAVNEYREGDSQLEEAGMSSCGVLRECIG